MRTLLPLWFAFISVSVTPAAAGEAIGSVYSKGAYRMDGVGARGNATVFDGSTLETDEAAAQIHLTNGANMWLAPKTRVTMSAQQILLLAGMGQFETPPRYRLETRAVRVSAAQPHTTVRMALDESGGSVVAPLNGAVEVTNSRGLHVGELAGGSAVRFANQPGSDSRVSVSGCMSRNRDEITLTDTVTNVPVRLTGAGLEKQIGHMVDVSGVESAPAGDTPVVIVSAVRPLSPGPCSAPAKTNVPAGLLAQARPVGIAAQIQTAGPRLMLVVVEGEGAINNIRQRTAREPIVEVQDENHRPVSGALVLFALPRGGAGGTFANGATTLRITTNAQGRAVARGLRPNRTAGQFEIAVTASFAGLAASIAIHQINSVNGLAPPGSSSTATATSNARTGGVSQPGATGAGDVAGTGGTGGTGSGGTPAGGTGSGSTAGAPSSGAGSGGGAAGGAGGGSGAGSGGASGAATGITIGAKVAIIGGITATAVVGGLAAAGVFNGGAEPAVSR